MNSANWAELAKTYQQVVTTAALAGDLLATHDDRKPPSIKRLVAAGATTVSVRAVLHTSDKVSQELFTKVSAKNAVFKKHYGSTTLFATTSPRGNRTCETT